MMPAPRRITTRAGLEAHMVWLRVAVHDRSLETRVMLEAVVDVLEALYDLLPGPPPGAGGGPP
jgi:hypothetical protein